MLDRVLHAMKIGEGWVALDHLVGKDSGETRVERGIDQLRFAYRHKQAFGRGGVSRGIRLAEVEVLLQRIFLLPGSLETVLEMAEYAHGTTSLLPE